MLRAYTAGPARHYTNVQEITGNILKLITAYIKIVGLQILLEQSRISGGTDCLGWTVSVRRFDGLLTQKASSSN